MCGRYVITSPEQAIRAAFDLDEIGVVLSPRYNVAPGQPVPVILEDPTEASDGAGAERGTRRVLTEALWGFAPGWMPDSTKGDAKGPRPINARGETVAEKPMFRDAFRRRRCLVPMDGFYEWSRLSGPKRPYLISRSDGAMMTVGGLVAERPDPLSPTGHRLTVAVITTPAVGEVAALHDRMPFMPDRDDFDLWLHGPAKAAADLIRPSPQHLSIRMVSMRVNAVRNDDPSVLIPDAAPNRDDGPAGAPGPAGTLGRNAGGEQGELF